jgi:hypothetical protein
LRRRLGRSDAVTVVQEALEERDGSQRYVGK